jgi:hypothetical protein
MCTAAVPWRRPQFNLHGTFLIISQVKSSVRDKYLPPKIINFFKQELILKRPAQRDAKVSSCAA